MLNRPRELITTKEKVIGAIWGLGAAIVTSIGVVLPTLEFIVGGIGGATGLGLVVTGVGTILTLSIGGAAAALVGGVAAYATYKSYVETAEALKKELQDQRTKQTAAENKLQEEIFLYFKAVMRLYMLTKANQADASINQQELKAFVKQRLPVHSEFQRRARHNLKKIFNMKSSEDVAEQQKITAVNIVGKIMVNPGNYTNLLRSLRGDKPANGVINENLNTEITNVKNDIATYYTHNYKDLKPKPANASYLFDGLLGGITGFVGVLGISSSVTTVSTLLLGVSFSVTFSFLISNPVGWGIIGAAVAIGIIAGVTYGYLQYKNLKRKEIIAAKQEKINQLEEQAAIVKQKREEIRNEIRPRKGAGQSAEALAVANLRNHAAAANELAAQRGIQLEKADTEIGSLRQQLDAKAQENAKLQQALAEREKAAAEAAKKDDNSKDRPRITRSASFSGPSALYYHSPLQTTNNKDDHPPAEATFTPEGMKQA